ncbi:MAG: hypothetical protein ACOC93_04180, partial [Planctomycetota bacterium]
MPELEDLLAELQPERLVRPISRRVNDALNRFHVSWREGQDREEFEQCVATFCYRADLPPAAQQAMGSWPVRQWWGLGRRLLERAYGLDGVEAAYRRAREGL